MKSTLRNIADWAMPVIVYVVWTWGTGAIATANAADGFYVMGGIGQSDTMVYDDDDEACQFGLGYTVPYKQVVWDFAYRNKFLCDADTDDDDADIETMTIDLYWYPFGGGS